MRQVMSGAWLSMAEKGDRGIVDCLAPISNDYETESFEQHDRRLDQEQILVQLGKWHEPCFIEMLDSIGVIGKNVRWLILVVCLVEKSASETLQAAADWYSLIRVRHISAEPRDIVPILSDLSAPLVLQSTAETEN